MNIKSLFLSFSFLLCCGFVFAQPSDRPEDQASAPKVFLMGEYTAQSEDLSFEYETLLLDACEYDMDKAYQLWIGMLHSMEDYSESIDFDLKGIKCWIKVFWDTDGTVSHITYFLKPNSKNVDTDELTSFFDSFASQYSLPFGTDEKFSHYGSASYPIYPKRIVEE